MWCSPNQVIVRVWSPNGTIEFHNISLLFELEATVAAALPRCATANCACRNRRELWTRTKLSTYSHGLHRRHGWYDLELQVRKLVAEGHTDAV